jgi:hypothetical protein
MKATFNTTNRSINRNRNIDNTMTKCHKGGIKIHNTNNEYTADPFSGINPFNYMNEDNNEQMIYNKSDYNNIDLNIDNYSREELFKLFGLKNMNLNEDIIKECKKIVLRTHPDKSKLDEQYFIFFSKAYNKLLGIFEFQNKFNKKKITDTNEYYDRDNSAILDKVFDMNSNLKESKNFNKWFNEQFDKNKVEETNESGYGSWLKSDEDIVYMPNVTKNNMASEMEKRKKEVKTLTTYNGVMEQCASSFGGSSLMSYDKNFTSNSLFNNEGIGYTDLRQAYVESVIPVTEEDYNNKLKFNSIDEYKRHRENLDTKPLSKEEAMNRLYNENKQKDEESTALAFYYAEQSEKIKKKQDLFWSGLKQITNK